MVANLLDLHMTIDLIKAVRLNTVLFGLNYTDEG